MTPKKIPKMVADVPIMTPTKKNILIIDLFNTPIDFKIAISRVLFWLLNEKGIIGVPLLAIYESSLWPDYKAPPSLN